MAVVNPVLLIEVTSRSTEEYDRTTKLDHYRSLASVREVLFVSHAEPLLTLHSRQPDGSWSCLEARAGESVGLACTGAALAVDEMYAHGLEDAG